MLHTIFITATWLIGLFGVGGAVAAVAGLVFLGPAAVTAIVEPLLAKFIACTWCIVAVVFVLSTTGAYWVGHHEEEKACRAADLAAELRNAQIDRDNAVKAQADESQRADTITETSNAQHQKDLADIDALSKRPATCAFDDTDAGVVPAGKPRSRWKKAPARPR